MKVSFKRQFLLPFFLIFFNFLLIFPFFRQGFPAQSLSLEPVVIAQARFIRQNWLQVSWNPYWYLGYPFRFNGSPFLPYLLALLNFLLPEISLWLLYRIITGVGLLLIPLGIYFLVKELTQAEKKENIAFHTGLIFTFLPSILFLFPQVFTHGRKVGFAPWQFFSLAYLGNGTKILGLALLPFCLLTVNRFLKRKIKRPFLPSALVALLALVDLSSVVSFLVLSILLLVTYAMTGSLRKKPKRLLTVLVYSFLLLSFYYSPRFWWLSLSAPSLAGKRAFSVILFLTRIFSLVVAMILAVFSSRILPKKKDRFFLFGFLWLLIFFLLTLSRFLADTDFWQDYTSWGIELGMGVSLFGGWLIRRREEKDQKPSAKLMTLLTLVVLLIIAGFSWFPKRKLLLGARPDISDRVEFKVANWLEENVALNERVYLSGSPVFWLNSLIDLAQVRGGSDKAATHPFWDHASYQIRVGEDSQLALEWLKALGVSYIVVHGSDSKEPYHDFVYPEKFASFGFKKVWEEEGDHIYRIDASIVRKIKDPDKFLSLKPPTDGADSWAITEYNAFLSTLMSFDWLNNSELVIKASQPDQAISLAITFDSGWQAWQDSKKLAVKKDPLGQMVIFSQSQGEIRLEYKKYSLEHLVGLILSIAVLVKLCLLS